MPGMTYGPYPATVRSWHDGDTCHLDVELAAGIDIDLGFAIHLTPATVHLIDLPSCRIFGINAPELSTPEGKLALAHALILCPVGTKVMVVSHGWDKYGGRFDGALTLPDGSSFGDRMIADGFAVVMPG